MVSIHGEILIERPVELVFDFVADERNEPVYNHRMVRAEKLTEGPIGKGTQFRAATRAIGKRAEMLIEITDYDRPRRLASTTRMSSADIRGAVTFAADPDGTRLRWSWDVQPKGTLRLLASVVGSIGRRQERQGWMAALKRLMEATS